MSDQATGGEGAPLTFANAPTVDIDGVRYLDDAAAQALGDRVALRYRELLERLAEEWPKGGAKSVR